MLASLHRLNIKLFGAYNLLSSFQLAELFSSNVLGVSKRQGSCKGEISKNTSSGAELTIRGMHCAKIAP
ncbi:uncharacterized protein MP3633_3062 [Marinomonas primoryensis]|uniref:Uncharacterized protein n=1 Tax=Marinomonas primoryensis TaxID=178399 RepID=A0A859D4E5_9GAMM|nr:uncharacterized protein MP3633_3062 [Marinomonas primoryensis]